MRMVITRRYYATFLQACSYTDLTQIGEFLHKNLIPQDLKIEDTVHALEGDQKAQFLEFAKKMLQWLPDDRNTAKQLIEDPWLSDDSIRRGG